MAEPPFRVLVVDDEVPARSELCYLLRQAPRVREVLEAEDASGAMDLLSGDGADVIFLDIQMPGLDGLQLARLVGSLAEPPPVVFVTAFQEHALDAFQLAAFDYLLKPVRGDRLNLTLERLALAARQPGRRPHDEAGGGGTDGSHLDDRLAVTHRGRILLLPIAEIRVAEVSGDRVALISSEGRFMARLRLQDLEERLARQGFMRVHRHYLVNLRHVSAVESFFNSTYLLRLDGVNDLTVPVSRRHGQQLRAALGL
ncbi:MAG: LytR/AlgR family response regulator transcription factor [Candidatus Dormibacteria bacterium]